MEPLSKIPAGLRYYFGAEARLKRRLEDECLSVFDGWGYEEIQTPTVDYYALFERGMGQAEAHRAFRFTDTDGRMLALRPDVTSGVARAAATLFAERARPLRLSYAASVFRQRPRSHAEWRRESRHLGGELIGAGGHAADLEMLMLAAEALERLGLRGRSRITLNHAGVFNGISARLALDADKREQMRQLVDRRDDAGLREFLDARAAASARAKDSPSSARPSPADFHLSRLVGRREALAEGMRLVTDAASRVALDALESIWTTLEALELTDLFEIDLGDVSGLDYYTGLIFKIYVEGAGARVGGGGRYDELAASFGGREPSIGFVLDLDALTDVLARRPSPLAARSEDKPTAVGASGMEAARLFGEARRRRERGERVRVEY